MNSLEASIRNTKSKGEVNSLRQKGEVPAIIYGGTEENQKVSLSKKQVKYYIFNILYIFYIFVLE